ncbi:MAG TPA: hypothetical protein PKA33_01520 [Amaricoccus sp.]|uniref:hypothetical protein n=1 Tax=Amaricoccus sp. TaxID=1872485 RepID=UPI002B7EC514|nr:hypothetical protein [Amaricoccus sp.]HMQ38984.1 hypothetical protein [Micropruina sp.]HMR51226.1 hypothetical protein [Amaricoccus sp.]HMT98025.1 hypothetical protein [Amaricoccus sp.]
MMPHILTAIDAVHKAFGAPGDYGYGTPEGDALLALYKAREVVPITDAVALHLDEARAALRLTLPCLVADAVHIVESDSRFTPRSSAPIEGSYGDGTGECSILNPILAAIRAAEAVAGRDWRTGTMEPDWIFEIIDGTRQP